MDERDDSTNGDSVPPIEEAETYNNSARGTEHDQRSQDEFVVGQDDRHPAEEYLSEVEPAENAESNVAGSLDRLEPLEPQEINAENALFVLLGVLLVVGFLVGALIGL